jgi:hypothetical protein
VDGERRFVGPALMCGEVFALDLGAGEIAIRRIPGVDFIIYDFEGPDGSFVLYEGNAPQPHDDEIVTGLDWPHVIAIHDNRSSTAKARSRIRDRLLVADALPSMCAAEAATRASR